MANRKCLDSMYDELHIVHDLHHFVDPPTLLFLLISLNADSVTLPDLERLPPLKIKKKQDQDWAGYAAA